MTAGVLVGGLPGIAGTALQSPRPGRITAVSLPLLASAGVALAGGLAAVAVVLDRSPAPQPSLVCRSSFSISVKDFGAPPGCGLPSLRPTAR